MIDYHTYHQICYLRDTEHLSGAKIAATLQLHRDTVSKWLQREKYQRRTVAGVARAANTRARAGGKVRSITKVWCSAGRSVTGIGAAPGDPARGRCNSEVATSVW